MSAFSQADFNTDRYNASRPSYPDEFYSHLNTYHRGSRNKLVDVGCGPGIATFQMVTKLAPFQQIIGTDLSAQMIARAQTRQSSTQGTGFDNVAFLVSAADDFSYLKSPCNMITAVECAHWFAFDKFQDQCFQHLTPGGTLAIWGYADSIFLDYPEFDQAILDQAYGEDQLGPYWEQPGRSILHSSLKDFHLKEEWFGDIEESVLSAVNLRKENSTSLEGNPLVICKEVSLEEFKEYTKTFSAYHAWKHDDKNKDKPDVCDELIKLILAKHPELTPQSRVRVAWNTFYKLGRRV
ncbi:hypothetical protein NCAS_0B04900 [Naumovozyma castellii]|uniref:Methyltransferase domain-containing protein n=1 Tax=Naumovozyma castellii TaxID=27288 RepID=G0V9F8_NAUCA|nr:hypothetical protein NCAS_0B04900 [Naumovozyma castellii CBS 4309]CCC68574.1 hypothetical protein NCAS_0B04900 [Naumovozyma castellii CBS 4309]